MELQPPVNYHLITRQCIVHMVHIALELAVLEVLYDTVEAQTRCIGDQHLTWLVRVEEISLCHLYITVLRLILLDDR